MKGEENMTYDLKCPYCGSDDVLLMESVDFGFDGDTAYVVYNAECHHCKHSFLQNDGYTLSNSWAEKLENK